VRIVPGRTARLAVTRTPRLAGDALLGPFPSQRAARDVLDAIQDAVPVARCADPRRHPAGCAFGEMGRCVAPCLPQGRPEHDRLLVWLRQAVADGGGPLLDRLDALMNARAGMLRFEEAAEVRERALLLARALERQRAQRALAGAGDLLVCVPRPPSLEVAAIRRGRLVRSWTQPLADPVRCEEAFEALTLADAAEATAAAGEARGPQGAGDGADIDETMIVWRFLVRAARRGGWVASCSGELASRIADRAVAERLASTVPAGRRAQPRFDTSTRASSDARARPDATESRARTRAAPMSGASPAARMAAAALTSTMSSGGPGLPASTSSRTTALRPASPPRSAGPSARGIP
jgi:hypothetical protein